MPNLTSQIASRVSANAVNVLTLSKDVRESVLADLLDLEGELMAQLERAAGKTAFTVARLNALLRQTRETIDTAYGGITSDSARHLSSLAGNVSKAARDAVNATIGAHLVTVALSPTQLEGIARNTVIFGRTSADWWSQQSAALQRKFETEMRMGWYRGETIEELARRVRGTRALNFTDGIMNASRAQAEALVRTSTIGVANESRLDTWRKNSDVISGIQWITAEDERVCDICEPLNGLEWSWPESGANYADYQPVDHGEDYPGPTAHWSCRCTQVPVTYAFDELSSDQQDQVPEEAQGAMDGEPVPEEALA